MKTTENKAHKNRKCLLFDLDDTLYPPSCGLWQIFSKRINRYLVEVLGFPKSDVQHLRKRLYRQYGTTLRGLQHEYEVDMDHYLAYVHDVPVSNYVKPDPDLKALLTALPFRKVIFTNAHCDHALRVTDALGITQHFDQMVDIYQIAPFCKPQPQAFEVALRIINEAGNNCILVDDSPLNLKTAESFDMAVISIGSRIYANCPHIHTINDLRGLFEDIINR